MSWFSNLIGQRKTVNSTKPIAVEALLPQALQAFDQLGCCVPNQCFRNEALAVANHDLAEHYVLCFVAQGEDREYGHAIVRIGESHYDPTLQSQQRSNLHYRLHSEYSKQKLRQLTLQGQTAAPGRDSVANVYPPALKSSCEIVFEPISGPNF